MCACASRDPATGWSVCLMPSMNSSHSRTVGLVRNSAASGRNLTAGKGPRVEPPAACTTSTAVREHALWLTLDVVAIADYERDLLLAVGARTTDSESLGKLRELAMLMEARRDRSRRTAAFMDTCAARLEEAEARQDWDGLADLSVYNGRQVAAFIIPMLDVLRDPKRLGEREGALARLVPYFEQIGEGLFEGKTTYHIGAKRTKTLATEFERWQRFGATT